MKTLRFPSSFFLLLLVFGCRPPGPNEVVARVAGEPIVVSDLVQSIFREGEKFGPKATADSKQFLKMKQSLLEDLIQKKILMKEALSQGVKVTDEDLEKEIRKFKSRYSEQDFQKVLEKRNIDYQAWREIKRVNLMTDHLIQEKLFAKVDVPEEKIRDYYDQHHEEFTQPEAVRVRQIVTETRGAAEAILKKLKDGENFARMARDLSIAPDRLQGGDLGFIPRGSFPKEFEICFDLKEGELSPIVSSLYGFHIFKVLEKRPEKLLPLDEVRAQIEEWLREGAREEAFQKYYQDLRKKYPVEIRESVLKRIRWEGPPLESEEK